MEDLKAKFQEKLSESDIQDLDNEDIYGGVYLFFSFDLVNSTYFKARFSEKWQEVFTRFYTFVENKLKNKNEDIFLWKYIGDEVLLYLKIKELDELFDAPHHAITIIDEVTEELYREIPEAQKLIYIKSTIWIADVQFQNRRDISQGDSSSNSNIIFFTGNVPEWLNTSRNIDFLGPDIDLGFRLGTYAEKSKLVVSAEIAYILQRKNGDIDAHHRDIKYSTHDCIKVVDLKELKGIWNGRKYPIIWFNLNWTEETYEYDEYTESELVEKIQNGQDLKINMKKVFGDVGKDTQLEKMIKKIEHTYSNRASDNINYDIPEKRLAEIHCAAICFNEDKMLMAKRSENKTNLPGKWEFGCGQLEINRKIEDCISDSYKSDFNAELDFIEDRAIPVISYTFQIEKENRVVPGVLFLARVKNPEDLINNQHDEIQWVTESKLDDISSEYCVADFHDSARRAFRLIKQVEDEKYATLS